MLKHFVRSYNVHDKNKLMFDRKSQFDHFDIFRKAANDGANSDVEIKSTRERSVGECLGIVFLFTTEHKELIPFTTLGTDQGCGKARQFFWSSRKSFDKFKQIMSKVMM